MKIFFILFFVCFAQADIYEQLSDFAYTKKSNKNIKIKKALIADIYQNNKKCLKILIQDNKIDVLNYFNECKKINNDAFLSFLNNDFLKLYKNDLISTNKYIKELKNIMQDIMISYKINNNFNINNKNLNILNLNNKIGGIILFKVNNQDCVAIKIFKEKEKMIMNINGIENLDKECKILINSPEFKDLSYANNNYKMYYLN